MKKLFVTLACIIVAGFANQGSAQPNNGPLLTENLQSLHIRSVRVNDVHTKAMRDFIKRNSKAVNIEWMLVNGGYVVKYNDNRNSNCRTVYSCHGNYVYTIKQYNEQQMLHEIRDMVKRTWYDYAINLVEEVLVPAKPVVYIVHLQDAATLKNIRISEGEMEVIEDHNRG